MKKLVISVLLSLSLLLSFASCDVNPQDVIPQESSSQEMSEQGTPEQDKTPQEKEDVITVEDGYVVVNGVKTEHKVDDGKCEHEPTPIIVTVVDGYLAINGVKTAYQVDDGECDCEPDPIVVTVIEGYLAINGEKTEHRVYADPVITVIGGYVAVNGVVTEYKVDTADEITVEDGYLVVNGEKTEYKVDDGECDCEPAPDVITVVDGYLVVNGVKTEYQVAAGCSHVWTTVTVAPTCSSVGYDTMTCLLCDKSVRVNETEKVDHTYASTYSIDNDYHWFACTVCGDAKDKACHNLDDEGVCTVCQLPGSSTPGVMYQESVDGTYAEVVGYYGTATKVKIAEEYNGLPVRTIYNSAFYDNDTITSVVIPDSVTSIGDNAFCLCTSLTSVVIGDSVTSIDYQVFYGCTSLNSVVIPVRHFQL